ncbi:MAG: hypothetical protein DRP55_07425 [Spirochaetes bacterium]|nr:MAG: hypothetical protein DRP55_07425 [Spirochaetota bacterium]
MIVKILKTLLIFCILFSVLLFSPVFLFSKDKSNADENTNQNIRTTNEDNTEANSINIKIVSVNDVKKLMSEKFKTINDYTANFEWINGDAHYKGKIEYKKPDKILLEFEEPKDQKIVSDGKILYIYLPSLRVVVKQTLSEGTESEILTTQSEKGLYKLFNEYAFSFYDKSTLQKFDDTMAYHLKLFQKQPKVGFKKMDIWVSKEGLILQSNGVSPNGLNVSLTFFNIKLNTEVPDYIFDFEIPADAQVIRNIIVPFSEKQR